MNGLEATGLNVSSNPRSDGLSANPAVQPPSGYGGEEPNGSPVGHRMQAGRSVLSIVVDERCVFAGLQGGDIVVCTKSSLYYYF